MDLRLIILFLTTVLMVTLARRYDDYDGREDYDRPSRSRGGGYGSGYGGGRRRGRGSSGYGGGYGGRGPLRNYAGNEADLAPMARALSIGGKGNYKGSGSAQANANVFGQKGGLRGALAQEGIGGLGGRWDSRAISVGGRGGSRGSGSGAVMADTWIGGGSGKAAGAHDVGGETGIVWDDGSDDEGMDRQGYLGNW